MLFGVKQLEAPVDVEFSARCATIDEFVEAASSWEQRGCLPMAAPTYDGEAIGDGAADSEIEEVEESEEGSEAVADTDEEDGDQDYMYSDVGAGGAMSSYEICTAL